MREGRRAATRKGGGARTRKVTGSLATPRARGRLHHACGGEAELARDVPEELKAPYSEALRLFATEPGIKGCMTKMILGYRCAETVPGGFTKKLVGEAKRRLREDFVFVGLTEEWDVSICVSPARRACDSSSQRD